MKKILALITMAWLTANAFAQTPVTQFSVATLNVDGLPPQLSALGLTIKINPEGPQEKYTAVIGQKLMEKNWDVIGLNEDFNFHDVLMQNMSGYQVMTHSGKFESSTAAALGILARRWRFKTDGLELLVKRPMNAYNEDIQAWNDCYGYFDHDNDSLTMKGFRRYEVDIDSKVTIDVIILHADADDYIQDIRARELQMNQMMDYVEKNIKCNHPLVIMGDFNQFYERDRLQELVIDRLNNNKSINARDAWVEYSKEHKDVPEMLDKILYVNRQKSDYKLILTEFGNGYDFLRDTGEPLSDHYPAFAYFDVVDNHTTGISEMAAPANAVSKRIVNGRLVIEKNGHRYGVMGEEL